MRSRLTRDQSRELTRGAVLDAAERLFVARGYRGASIDDIANAAGFSKGAVYSNFASKADLFLALLDRKAVREEGALASSSVNVAGDQAAWPLATLDFFVDAIRDPTVRAGLAERYAQARLRTGRALASDRTEPAWASWEEIATLAMALGSGLIIQSAIDPPSVAPDLFGRAMERLLRP